MRRVAFDWSRFQVDYTFDGTTSAVVADLPALLEVLAELGEPCDIVCEATFESYEPEKRQWFIDECARRGHRLRVFNPRLTAYRRTRDGIEKDDATDSLVIFKIAFESSVHLAVPKPVDSAWVEKRERVNREHTISRFTGTKDALAEQAIDVLGPYGELTEDQRLVLGNGREYAIPLLSAIVRATMHATSREEFERLLGLYANAYPSHLRSDVHHWGYRIRNGGIGKNADGTPKFRRQSVVEWKTFRRVLRGTYQQLKRAGIGRPAPDKP